MLNWGSAEHRHKSLECVQKTSSFIPKSTKSFPLNECAVLCVSPWFRYVSVSSCSLTAGEVAVHSTYWNGGFLVSFSGGRLESSCLKIGRASTSLRDRKKEETVSAGTMQTRWSGKQKATMKVTQFGIFTEQHEGFILNTIPSLKAKKDPGFIHQSVDALNL